MQQTLERRCGEKGEAKKKKETSKTILRRRKLFTFFNQIIRTTFVSSPIFEEGGREDAESCRTEIGVVLIHRTKLLGVILNLGLRLLTLTASSLLFFSFIRLTTRRYFINYLISLKLLLRLLSRLLCSLGKLFLLFDAGTCTSVWVGVGRKIEGSIIG